MIKVALNIGSLNQVPMFWEFESIRDFIVFIRENSIEISSWYFQSYGTGRNIKLGIYIKEDDINNIDEYWEWNFIINCNNIREFKPLISLSHDDFNSLLKKHERSKKLDSFLK